MHISLLQIKWSYGLRRDGNVLFGFFLYFSILFGFFIPYGSASIFVYASTLYYFTRGLKYSRLSFYFLLSGVTLLSYISFISIVNLDGIVSWFLIKEIFIYLTLFVLFVLIIELDRFDNNWKDSFFRGIVLIGFIASLLSISNYVATFYFSYDFLSEYSWMANQQSWSMRLTGVLANPNNLAYFLSLPVLLHLYLISNRKKIIFDYFIFLVLVFSVLLTGSKGAIIPLILSFILLFYFFQNLRKFLIKFLFLFIVVVVVFFNELGDIERVSQLLDRLLLSEGLTSNQYRGKLLFDYLKNYENNPLSMLFGNGFIHFVSDKPPDNSLLRMIYHFGFVLAFIPIFFFIFLYRKYFLMSTIRSDKYFSLIIVFFTILSSLSNDWIISKTFWIFIAISIIILRKEVLASSKRQKLEGKLY
jgi:hypothetical protein